MSAALAAAMGKDADLDDPFARTVAPSMVRDTPAPGRTDGWTFPRTPGKQGIDLAFSPLGATAQELRVGRAELAKLRDQILPALEAQLAGGAPTLAHLEATTAMRKIEEAIEHSGAALPQPGYRPIPEELVPLYVARAELAREYPAVKGRVEARLALAAERRASAARGVPTGPVAQPTSFTKHAAVPPGLSFGKIAPGATAVEEVTAWNLVAGQSASVQVSLTGDRAFQLLAAPTSLAPAGVPMGGQNASRVAFVAPDKKGVYHASLSVAFSWGGDAIPPETFAVPIVAYAMRESDQTDEERTASEAAARQETEKTAAAARDRAQAEQDLAEFSRAHPSVDTDAFDDLREEAQIQVTRLFAKQQAGIDAAHVAAAKYKRRKLKHGPDVWMDLAMLALDVGTAGIAGSVAKALESRLAASIVRRVLPDGVHGPIQQVPRYASKATIALFTDSVKEGLKGGAKLGRKYAMAAGGGGQRDGGADKNYDDANDFFTAQSVALADAAAERATGVIEAAAKLRPLLYADPDAALAVMRELVATLAAEADGAEPAVLQRQASVEGWVNYVAADDATPLLALNQGGRADASPIGKARGIIDIGFRIGDDPLDPVTVVSARMLGVSDTVARLFQDRPLNTYDVIVRAYGVPSEHYAEVPITIVRYPDGRLEFLDQVKNPWERQNWLSRKVHRPRGDAQEAGARYLMEQEIMSKSLADHGVAIRHDHDNG